MGPVLEQSLVLLIEPLEVLGAIARFAREKDQVMGPRHCIDAVELYEPQPLDQFQ